MPRCLKPKIDEEKLELPVVQRNYPQAAKITIPFSDVVDALTLIPGTHLSLQLTPASSTQPCHLFCVMAFSVTAGHHLMTLRNNSESGRGVNAPEASLPHCRMGVSDRCGNLPALQGDAVIMVTWLLSIR